MPVQFSADQISQSQVVPVTLEGQVSQESWTDIQHEMQRAQSNSCMMGTCFALLCTLVFGPIGLIVGLCGCGAIIQSHKNSHCITACNNINNRHYGGRRVFDWQGGVLTMWPENARGNVVFQQPVMTSAVYGTQPQGPVVYVSAQHINKGGAAPPAPQMYTPQAQAQPQYVHSNGYAYPPAAATAPGNTPVYNPAPNAGSGGNPPVAQAQYQYDQPPPAYTPS